MKYTLTARPIRKCQLCRVKVDMPREKKKENNVGGKYINTIAYN